MKRAEDLTREELEEIVDEVQRVLWLDVDDDGELIWDPDKEWDSDSIDQVAQALLNIEPDLKPEDGDE